MTALLLSVVLALQGIPVQAQQAGKVSGILKDAQGKPIPGIRMAAIARTESLDEAITSPAMSSLAETDEQGRYTLEGVPPGRYFIAAGRLDVQTYYPGTADLTMAKEVAITPGLTVTGIDFTLGESSFGRASTGLGGLSASIPLRVTVEGGGKLPLSSAGKFITLKLDMGTSVVTTPIANATVSVPGPQTTAYRVTVENLPETYVVKSINYGATDLLKNPLRLTPANFSGSAPNATAQAALQYAAMQAFAAGIGGATAAAPPQSVRRPEPTAVLPAGTSPVNTVGMAIQAAAAVGVPFATQPASTPLSVLYLTLAPMPAKATSGVRVSGRMSVRGNRTVYVSGIPGTVYSDGTFEVYGIAPGRHSIVTRDNSAGPLAASVVVENSNLDDIVLVETAMLPIRAWEPSPPRPAGGHPVGNVPLARLTGVLVEELSKNPIREGTVIIKTNGYYSASFPVDAEGHFELPPLLPGNYDLEVQIFGHSNIKQTIEIDDKDMKLELISRKLY